MERTKHLDGLGKLLNSLGYRGVLARGYAVITDADGALVRSAAALAVGQAIGVEFADGRIAAHVDGDAASAAPRPRRRKADPGEPGGQQSLF